MHLSMILPVALAGLAFARPQRGSLNVLGFCHTHTKACSYTSLYDCTNRGGQSQYYCINTCACENKYQPPNLPAPVPPKPSPIPLDKSGKQEGSPPEESSPEDNSSEDANPGGSSPEDTAPEDSAPEDTSTEDTSPEETASEGSSPEDTATEPPEESGESGETGEGED